MSIQDDNPDQHQTSGLIVTALESYFRSERDVSIANLSVYVNSPAGVGDHPSIVDDCTKLIKKISEAEEGLKVIQKIFRRQN